MIIRRVRATLADKILTPTRYWRFAMRVRLLVLVLAITLVADAAASHHDVTLTVVTSVAEDVTVPDGGVWSSQTTITSVTGGDTCPEHSNPVGLSNGTVTQCQWGNVSSGGSRGNGTTVRAFLTTTTGEVFDVSMFCSRLNGRCPEPKAGSMYSAQLDDAPKYLANYAPRREYGPMKVKFAPDGKKSVTYSIIFAMRAGSHQSHPD